MMIGEIRVVYTIVVDVERVPPEKDLEFEARQDGSDSKPVSEALGLVRMRLWQNHDSGIGRLFLWTVS